MNNLNLENVYELQGMICTRCGCDNKYILWPIKIASLVNERLCDQCLLTTVDLAEAKNQAPECSHDHLDEMYESFNNLKNAT